MISSSDRFVPYETDRVELSEPGVYYLTPIAYTHANPTMLISINSKDNGWPFAFIVNEARRLFKVTIEDSGITVETPDYDQWHAGKSETYSGESKILLSQNIYAGIDIRTTPGTTTYRVDMDESQWGVGVATEITS